MPVASAPGLWNPGKTRAFRVAPKLFGLVKQVEVGTDHVWSNMVSGRAAGIVAKSQAC